VDKIIDIPVCEHFSFVKIIHPPDRCGISRSWITALPLHRCTLCWSNKRPL
jgi:hypothetical protein